MTRSEKAAMNHAAEWLRYARSPQAKRDLAADAIRRAKADKAAGHFPSCGLVKCAHACPSMRCH